MSRQDSRHDHGLYVVATPLGNAQDITFRARDILANADVVLAESTSETAKLLTLHGITRPISSYREENAERVTGGILATLAKGAVVALVSDAGTPLISDPGARLVHAAIEAGIRVFPVPGPSAGIAALSAAGIAALPALHLGFLPEKQGARLAQLQNYRALAATLVIFEAPHRLIDLLDDACSALGDRKACVARELTKTFEEFSRGTLSELAAQFRNVAPRGEIVVVIAPPEADTAPDGAALDCALVEAMATLSLKDAADAVAKAMSVPRRMVYARALELKAGKP